jgi:hypothetical protein
MKFIRIQKFILALEGVSYINLCDQCIRVGYRSEARDFLFDSREYAEKAFDAIWMDITDKEGTE